MTNTAFNRRRIRRQPRLESLEGRRLLTAAPGSPAELSLGEGEGTPIVDIRLQVSDLDGQATSQVTVGDTFLLQAFVRDQRLAPEVADGVFAAFMDILYDSDLLSALESVRFDAPYDVAKNADLSTPGVLNEIGAASSSLAPLGNAERLLVSITMRAVAEGTATLVSEEADEMVSEVLVYNLNDLVDPSQISFGQTSVTIVLASGANDDLFRVPANSTNNSLEVLANDLPSTPGEPSLVGSTSAPSQGGSVQIAPDGRSLIYSPKADFRGVETFTYTISGSAQAATVTIEVDPPAAWLYVARDDELAVDQDSRDNPLNVLGNDDFVESSDTIVNVSSPDQGGQVQVDNQRRALLYTPPTDFAGTDSFTYTVENGAGQTRTAQVRVIVTAGSKDLEFRLRTASLDGDPISSIAVNEEFLLQVFVNNLRPLSESDILSAFLDVFYDSQRAFARDSIQYPGIFTIWPSGDTGTAGLINELGAASDFYSSTAEQELHVADVVIRALSPGVATFEADPADHVLSGILLENRDEPLDVDRVLYGETSITVLDPGPEQRAFDDFFSVSRNSQQTSLAILGNDRLDTSATVRVTVEPGAGAEVTRAENGAFLYTPAPGYSGQETFTYSVVDLDGTADTAMVTINVLGPSSDNSAVNFAGLSGGSVTGGLDLRVYSASGDSPLSLDSVSSYTLSSLPAGEYRIRPAQAAPFLLNSEVIMSVRETNQGKVSSFDAESAVQAHPRYIGASRYLASAPEQYVLLAVDETGASDWYSLIGSWDGIAALDAQLADDYSSLTLTMVRDDLTRFTTTITSLSQRGVHLLGATSTHRLLRLPGDFEQLNFRMLSPALGAAASRAAGENARTTLLPTLRGEQQAVPQENDSAEGEGQGGAPSAAADSPAPMAWIALEGAEGEVSSNVLTPSLASQPIFANDKTARLTSQAATSGSAPSSVKASTALAGSSPTSDLPASAAGISAVSMSAAPSAPSSRFDAPQGNSSTSIEQPRAEAVDLVFAEYESPPRPATPSSRTSSSTASDDKQLDFSDQFGQESADEFVSAKLVE